MCPSIQMKGKKLAAKYLLKKMEIKLPGTSQLMESEWKHQ